MRPIRSPRLPGGFTFGGRVPPAVGLVVVLLVAGTLIGWITGWSGLAALDPIAIGEGQLWRLVSWAFVQPRGDVFGLLFAALLIWWTGAQLCYAWGEARFLARFFGFAFAASVVATAIAIVWSPARAAHLGVWPVANALLFSWAMIYPDQQVNIWGVLPVTGRTLGLMVVIGTVLYGLATGGVPGIGLFVPHLAALGLAWVFARGRLPTRRWRLQARDWWSEREFKRKSKHLKVVRKDGKDEPPRW